MKKIFLAGLVAVSFAVSSGLFSAANATVLNGSGNPQSGPYTNAIGSQG